MGRGLGILLLVIGMILVLDVVPLPDSVTEVVEADTIGWLCVIVGALTLAVALVLSRLRPKAAPGEELHEG